MGAILASLLAAPAIKQLIGAEVAKGVGRLSKTKVGANIAIGGAAWAVIPELLGPALGGDPTAIGKLILLVGGWLMALWGRGSKG